MAIINVSTDTQLRSAIQAATSGDALVLQGTGPYLPLSLPNGNSLGKRYALGLATPVSQSGYTVQGTSTTLASSATLRDYSIYQQNVNGAFAPGVVKNLTLNFTTASNGRPILSYNSTYGSPARSILIDNVAFTGTSTGWISNGGNYMSLISSNASQPTSIALTLQGSSVAISGQSGTSAFLRSWNNNASVNLTGNTFTEVGFNSSFNFLSYNTTSKWGSYTLTNNIFTGQSGQTTRAEGNKLDSVTATLTDNQFRLGSFLDLSGDVSTITFAGNNLFATIPNGFGIRVTNTTGRPIVGTPIFTGATTFSAAGLSTASGLVLKYVSASPGAYTVLPSGSGSFLVDFRVSGQSPINFGRLSAGGQAADTIDFSTSGLSNWLSGDDGNDTIRGGSSVDYILGGAGNDSITGGAGNDSIVGETGTDLIFGDNGNDTLNGSGNNDTLTGGAGADRFQWLLNSASDTITDFNLSEGDGLTLSKVATTFTNTTVNNTLAAADYIVAANLTNITTSSTGKLTNVTTAQTATAINNFTLAGLTTAYVLVRDSGTGVSTIIYDADWSNTANRFTLNLGSANLSTFSNSNVLIQI